DRALALMQEGDAALQQGDLIEARLRYSTAARLDPALVEARVAEALVAEGPRDPETFGKLRRELEADHPKAGRPVWDDPTWYRVVNAQAGALLSVISQVTYEWLDVAQTAPPDLDSPGRRLWYVASLATRPV